MKKKMSEQEMKAAKESEAEIDKNTKVIGTNQLPHDIADTAKDFSEKYSGFFMPDDFPNVSTANICNLLFGIYSELKILNQEINALKR